MMIARMKLMLKDAEVMMQKQRSLLSSWRHVVDFLALQSSATGASTPACAAPKSQRIHWTLAHTLAAMWPKSRDAAKSMNVLAHPTTSATRLHIDDGRSDAATTRANRCDHRDEKTRNRWVAEAVAMKELKSQAVAQNSSCLQHHGRVMTMMLMTMMGWD